MKLFEERVLSFLIVVCFCREGDKIDAGTETNSNLYHELYYHFLETDQSEDVLCWRDQDNPKHMFGSKVTDDGKVKPLIYNASLKVLVVTIMFYS